MHWWKYLCVFCALKIIPIIVLAYAGLWVKQHLTKKSYQLGGKVIGWSEYAFSNWLLKNTV